MVFYVERYAKIKTRDDNILVGTLYFKLNEVGVSIPSKYSLSIVCFKLEE